MKKETNIELLCEYKKEIMVLKAKLHRKDTQIKNLKVAVNGYKEIYDIIDYERGNLKKEITELKKNLKNTTMSALANDNKRDKIIKDLKNTKEELIQTLALFAEVSKQEVQQIYRNYKDGGRL